MAVSLDWDHVSDRWRNMNENSLVPVLLSQEGLNSVLQLAGGDAAFVVNILDRALRSTSIDLHQRKRCTVALTKLCGTLSFLPASHLLSEGLEKVGDSPRASGGFADVWEGRYNGQMVAIKVLKRTVTDDGQKVEKSFYKEVLIWKGLSHPNILPFLGVATSPFTFGMVSPWMTHGNIVQYLKLHPRAYMNIGLLLSGIAEGLKYLHENGLVHGDLKGSNIMIRDDHQACLADFGLMTIISDSLSTYATTTVQTRGTTRWMAPELLNPEGFGFDHCSPSRQSDVYAFGMVIYELLTGNIPFIKSGNLAVMLKVVRGDRPEWPNDDVPFFGYTDIVWRLAEECWDQDRNKRPSINEVLNCLNTAVPNMIPKEEEFPVPNVELKSMKECQPPLGRHNGVVHSVTFSPDGQLIASGGRDRTIRVWDAYSGKELKGIEGHSKGVNSIAFSPDSARIASGSDDRMVSIWDARSGARVLGPLTKHRDWVSSVQFSPDGTMIVSGSYNGTIYVWNATSGRTILGPLIHSDRVYSVAFSPDSTRIISCGRDKTIRVWDAKSGQMVLRPLQLPKWPRAVAYSPDGMRIVSGCDDNRVRMWNANSGVLVTVEPSLASVWSIAFSPDGKRIVFSGGTDVFDVWDVMVDDVINKKSWNHGSLVKSVGFSPDGEWIVTGGNDGKIRLW